MSEIAQYLASGEKTSQSIGVEVEHFILHQQSGMPMPYELMEPLLAKLANQYRTCTYEQGHLIALEKHWTLLTLEPGCQLELSMKASEQVDQIFQEYEKAILPIQKLVEDKGYQIVYSGGLPSVAIDSVKRIPKKRYELMEAHFQQVGTRGKEMMKGTASIHVSVDYQNEQDFIHKMRRAYTMHPLFQFVSSNTPFYQGKKNDDVLLRTSIWHQTDSSRCGIIPHLFSPHFGYEAYAEFVNSVPLILLNQEDDFVSVGQQTVAQVASQFGYENHIEHYLSMVFPDVRAKKFIEIRSADALPLPWAKDYVNWVQQVMYQEKGPIAKSEQEILAAIDEIRKKGYQAKVYGRPIKDWLLETMPASSLKEMVRKEGHVFELSNLY